MILSLRPVAVGADRLVLTVSPGWRLFFGLLGLFLSAGMAVLSEYPVALVVAAILCMGTAAYDERWTFDRPSSSLERKRGFGPLSSAQSYRLDEFSSVVIGSVASPSFAEDAGPLSQDPALPALLRKGRATLRLRRRDLSRSLLVEDGSHRDREELLKLGRMLADWSGLPLEGEA